MSQNPLFNSTLHATQIGAAQQAQINQLPVDPQGFSPEDESFLYAVLEKIKNGTINLYQPSTLLNLPVYNGFSEEAKGKADQNAMVLITKLREIYNLWQVSPEPTYAVRNLIHAVRVTKERLESDGGDVYII